MWNAICIINKGINKLQKTKKKHILSTLQCLYFLNLVERVSYRLKYEEKTEKKTKKNQNQRKMSREDNNLTKTVRYVVVVGFFGSSVAFNSELIFRHSPKFTFA